MRIDGALFSRMSLDPDLRLRRMGLAAAGAEFDHPNILDFVVRDFELEHGSDQMHATVPGGSGIEVLHAAILWVLLNSQNVRVPATPIPPAPFFRKWVSSSCHIDQGRPAM